MDEPPRDRFRLHPLARFIHRHAVSKPLIRGEYLTPFPGLKLQKNL